MTTQELLTLLSVGLAAGYVLYSFTRVFFQRGKGCSSGCGGCASTPVPPTDTRRRSLPVLG